MDRYTKKMLAFSHRCQWDSVREIGASVFADIKMDGVELIDSIKVVGECAFRNTEIAELKFSTNLEAKGEAAFEVCNLKRIEFPETLSFIGHRAFAGNADLWTVLIRMAMDRMVNGFI